MTENDEFIRRLTQFGLSEKEAQLYLHLLRYGPKTPSPLAKSLKTYREDVHRTLTSLIEKGMVRPSLYAPTVYTAVDLDTALEAALKKHESELREMETRKQELQELAQQHVFRPSDEVALTFKIIKSIRELITMVLPILTSLEEEWLSVVPFQAAVVFSQFGLLEFTQEFIERGGRQLTVINLTYPIIGTIHELLDIGAEVRHLGEGFSYNVFDKKISISAINASLTRFSPDEPLSALYSEDRTYARYLISTFEMLWKQSIPAEERIQELLEQGPPQV
jgi:sugar-specific transcriptional regulator TrmB